MINELNVRRHNKFLLRPHKCNTFSFSPVRFITVIKVLFAHTLLRKVSPHVRSVSSVADQNQPDFCWCLNAAGLLVFFFFPFLLRWSLAAWIINSQRLHTKNKLLHLSMKMIEQRDDKCTAAHLSKPVYTVQNPSCWIHLKNCFVIVTFCH